jgi:hypothetical protein
MNAFMVFLVMLIPNTDVPALALMHTFNTVRECKDVIRSLPPENRAKFSCIKIDMRPDEEVPTLKLKGK